MTLLQLIRFKMTAHRLAVLLERRRAARITHLRDAYAVRQRGIAYNNQGFTLLELMIVVLIIGILAAVAIPAYANYTVKASASEAIRMLDGAEAAIAESYMTNGIAPGNAAEAGISQGAGKYVASLSVGTGGAIWAVFAADAPAGLANNTIQMTPYTTSADPGSPIGWTCGFAQPPGAWVALTPGTTNPPPGTTVPATYLPRNCRAGG